MLGGNAATAHVDGLAGIFYYYDSKNLRVDYLGYSATNLRQELASAAQKFDSYNASFFIFIIYLFIIFFIFNFLFLFVLY